MITKVYTRTFNSTPRRFESSDSIVWACINTPSLEEEDYYEVEFGEVIWEIDVCLPDKEKGQFLFSGEYPKHDWLWGKHSDKECDWVCFKAGLIISKRIIN